MADLQPTPVEDAQLRVKVDQLLRVLIPDQSQVEWGTCKFGLLVPTAVMVDNSKQQTKTTEVGRSS